MHCIPTPYHGSALYDSHAGFHARCANGKLVEVHKGINNKLQYKEHFHYCNTSLSRFLLFAISIRTLDLNMRTEMAETILFAFVIHVELQHQNCSNSFGEVVCNISTSLQLSMCAEMLSRRQHELNQWLVTSLRKRSESHESFQKLPLASRLVYEMFLVVISTYLFAKLVAAYHVTVRVNVRASAGYLTKRSHWLGLSAGSLRLCSGRQPDDELTPASECSASQG